MIERPDSGATLAQAFAARAAASPDAALHVASATRGVAWTLTEIAERGALFGAHLQRHGIGASDVVAVQLPAWAEWLIACVGIARAGAVMLPVVSIYGPGELGFLLGQSGARAIVTPDHWRGTDHALQLAQCGALPALRHHIVVGTAPGDGTLRWEMFQVDTDPAPPVDRDPDDLAMLLYTSGTSSAPKGVRHSSRSLLAEIVSISDPAAMGQAPCVLSPWPPGHMAGVSSLLRYLVSGIPLVLMDRWDAGEAAALIDRHGVTACSATPVHLRALLDAADAQGCGLASLSRVMVGAMPVPPDLIERSERRGLRTFHAYGSTEVPTITSGASSDPLDKRLATEGRPMPGIEIAFLDEADAEAEQGELIVRGPERFLGYVDAALDREALLPGGWFRTGDIGRFDADGYLCITDRKKDIIIRGGENIASREVEELLCRQPEIAEAAVVAAPDTRMGERVCAFVVPAAGAMPTLETIRAHFAATGVARQKTPEQLELVAELPRNATGKVRKQALRERVAVAMSETL